MFINMVNKEHNIYQLEQNAIESSVRAKQNTADRKIMKANALLIKITTIMAGATILALIIK